MTTSNDLYLSVDRQHVRHSLRHALRDAIRAGRLGPGAALPSSRTLAADLGVARNTVAEAYSELVAEGWLTARAGSKTRVAGRTPTRSTGSQRDWTSPLPYDLRPGLPNPSSFPRRAWVSATRRALSSAPSTAFGYDDPRGQLVLREALAAYLARSRGVVAEPDRIVVCLGSTHGIGLLARVVAARGAGCWAVEEHGLWVHRSLLARAGFTLRPIPVDEEGARTDLLAAAGAVLLTPNNQYPLGVTLSPARRARAVGWARDTGGLIVEDDYDGEFRHDHAQVAPLQSAASDRVVYAGTASKSLAPGLRLGWLVAPPPVVKDVMTLRGLDAGYNSCLEQLTLAELLRSGAYDAHVRACRVQYGRRRDALLAALETVGTGQVSATAAGLHLLVSIPNEHSEEEAAACAAEHGLAVEGLALHRAPGAAPRPPHLVVGYGAPPDHLFRSAVASLIATLQRLSRRPTPTSR